LLDYAFSQIALSIVRLEVLEFNAPAIKVYKRLGFKSHGETGWHCDEFGQYWRVIGMHIHDHQW
jgi:RimJ/RimL family protein N-acetyltransferase